MKLPCSDIRTARHECLKLARFFVCNDREGDEAQRRVAHNARLLVTWCEMFLARQRWRAKPRSCVLDPLHFREMSMVYKRTVLATFTASISAVPALFSS